MPTISMTCPNCQRGFKRRTRKGLRTSCPHCSHVMPGPEGQKLVEQRQRELEGQRARRRERERKATPGPPAQTPPATRRRARTASKTGEGQPPAPAAAPGTETQVPRHPDSKPPQPAERHPNVIF